MTSPATQAASVDTGDAIVRIRGLRFSRGDNVIFDGIDIDVPRGGIVAILGPSGTGKTTLLKLILGQLKPTSGEIFINDQPVHDADRKTLFKLRREIGVLFQTGALLTDLTVFDNVALPIREHTDLPEELIDILIKLKLEAVGLRGAAHMMPAQLSGGMTRRVALARAVALDPQLVLYDEPFAGLDPIVFGTIRSLVHELTDTLGLTSLVVTHNVSVIESIADYVYIIAQGKVMGRGTPAEIQNTESEAVKQFLGGRPEGPVATEISVDPIAKALGLASGGRHG